MSKKLEKIIEKCNKCPYIRSFHNGSDFSVYCGHPDIDKDFKQITDEHDGVLTKCPLQDADDLGVKTGVAVFFLMEDNKLLLGQRKNTTSGEGYYGLPGGRMDRWEDPQRTAKRESEEETGIKALELEFFDFTNDEFKDSDEHWITLYYVCRKWEGEPQLMEPEKCEGWDWHDIDNLPEPLYCHWKEKIQCLKKLK